MLEIKNLSCGYEKTILENISFTGESGDIVCILGANGSGKSTLIKTIVGLLEPHSGDVFIENENIKNWSWKKRAQSISYIPQTFSSTFQYKGIDIVLMGRTSYLGLASSPSEKDLEIAEKSMEKLKILHLKDKVYSKMSGGERQLVKIAQALAQESKIIVMDEPTNNLDFGNQITMLNHLKQCAEMGMTVVMATHFPDQALAYGTKALLVKNGEVEVIPNPKENITEKDLQNLYNVNIKIFELDFKDTTMKMCLPV